MFVHLEMVGNILDLFKSFEVLSFVSVGEEPDDSAQLVSLEGQLHRGGKLDCLSSV